MNKDHHNDNIELQKQKLSHLATIGQLSAGIAHEIRNPLTAAKGFLQLLKKEVSHQYLDIAFDELERAILTIHDLLQLSKPDQNDEPFQPLSLCSELEAVISLFQNKMYHVQIRTHFQNTDTTVCGQKNQLRKAFFNLLKNAFEAITEEGTIIIEHIRKSDHLHVSFTDTGHGISSESLSILGTPFYTTKSEGTGLGLTQVYSVLSHHQASLDVDSAEGKGTSFTIKFPLDPLT